MNRDSRAPGWLGSLAIHGAIAVAAGAFWIVRNVEENETVVSIRPADPPPVILMTPLLHSRTDDHPPIIPKKFVPARVVNDATEVVENTHPENLRTPDESRGDDLDFVSDRPLDSRSVYDVVGAGGGAGGRYGSPTFVHRFG